MRELHSTIDEWKAGRPESALAIVNGDAGLRLMSEIRRVAGELDRQENQLLGARQSKSKRFNLFLQAGVVTAFLLMCFIGALVIALNRRSLTEIGAAHDQLVLANQKLTEQINEREKAESQLRQSQKMQAIGQLTGGIAHDFNNMLGVIIGSIELMQGRIKRGDFAIERFLDGARTAADRAASLTKRLLAFARQQPLSPEPLDANKMIAKMSDLLRSTLGGHIRIETVTAGGLWLTKADLPQLESAILNIAINARDAMPDGGRLTIETGNAYLDEAYCRQNTEVEPGQYVMIAVSDTGTGMPPDVVARAFDPFFTTKAVGSGTGLGLSQVHGFAKQSGGHIKIYSEPGSGTTVKLYLPRFIGKVDELERAPARASSAPLRDDVLLVVEDDLLMRRHTCEALQELGYTVLDAENAQQALELLDRRPDIKLLFTDIVMPDVNGKKLADEAVRRRPELKVLFMTGYTRNAVVHGGVLDPGIQFLSKPFTLEQVAAKIRAILDEAKKA